MIIYVIIAIVFFGILVGIHEFGHFAVAKLCGIRVEEFAIGMGPAIFQKKKGETLYSLRCIPFGGYCAMTGEDGESEDPRAFVNQKVWKRFLVLVAGAFMNFLLGFIIVLCLFAGAEGYAVPSIVSFMDGCPYESAEGFQAGDWIMKIDGHRVYSTADVTAHLREDTPQTFLLMRNGEEVTLRDYSMKKIEYTDEEGNTGRYFGFRLGWQSLGMLLSGQAKVTDLSGPVGIVDLMAETGENAATASDAAFNIAYLGAFIAVNLAVMNLLPIPALDGGRIFLLLITWVIETLTRRKLNPKFEAYIHGAGMVLLLALMAFVMLNDIVRIVKGG